jgi:hypothetical protein
MAWEISSHWSQFAIIAVLPAANSYAYNLDLTSYTFCARLLGIHGVYFDTNGVPNCHFSDVINYNKNKITKSLIT